jgi:hypothetical protein
VLHRLWCGKYLMHYIYTTCILPHGVNTPKLEGSLSSSRLILYPLLPGQLLCSDAVVLKLKLVSRKLPTSNSSQTRPNSNICVNRKLILIRVCLVCPQT